MLTERQKSILSLLLHAEDGLTTEWLAQKLGVSSKTIRADLQALSERLVQSGEAIIRKKPGVGISLEVRPGRHAGFNALISSGERSWGDFDDRRHYILRRLLFLKDGEAVTETSISETLLVSRTSIKNDLAAITDQLLRYNLRLCKRKNRGITLQGREFDKRTALAKLFLAVARTKGIANARLTSGLTTAQELAFQHLFPFFDYRPIVEIIRELERKASYTIEHNNFVTLAVYCALSVFRYRAHLVIKLNDDQQRQMVQAPLPETISMVERRVASAYGVHLPPAELFYIYMYVLASGVCEADGMDAQRKAIADSAKFQQFSGEVLETIQNILGMELEHVDALIDSIKLHLSGVICRLKCGIRIQNPLLQDVKESYPSFFGAAWATSVLFEKHYHLTVSDDEIGFLAMYIGTAAKSRKHCVRTCVVCNYGVSVSGLISEQLRRAVPELEIKDILSAERFRSVPEHELVRWDMVISTVESVGHFLPVVNVNSILKSRDLQRISDMAERIMRRSPCGHEGHGEAEGLFHPELIFLHFPCKNKTEAILRLCEELSASGHVAPEFTESVLARERTVSTEVGFGVAIPHGNPQTVFSSAIAVALLKDPIKWAGEDVDVIFLIALSSRQLESQPHIARGFYKTLALLLDSTEMQAKLRALATPQDICGYLNDN